ncbi:hypothetical protein ACJX0J_005966, partial [Zea mays]
MRIVFGPSFQIFWRRIGNIAQDNRLLIHFYGTSEFRARRTDQHILYFISSLQTDSDTMLHANESTSEPEWGKFIIIRNANLGIIQNYSIELKVTNYPDIEPVR